MSDVAFFFAEKMEAFSLPMAASSCARPLTGPASPNEFAK
jgi:hypothetical protein